MVHNEELLELGSIDYDELDEELGEPLGLTIFPESGYRTDKFKVTVYGMEQNGWVASSKPGYGRFNDPKIREVYGNESFEVTGAELLKGREFKETEHALIWVYACDDRLILNAYSSSVQVMIYASPQEVPTTTTPVAPTTKCTEGATERVYDTTHRRHYVKVCAGGQWTFSHWEVIEQPSVETVVPGIPAMDGTSPGYLSIDEALYRTAAGLPCYIKCALPILNLLPGLPWSPSIPMLPGFIITKRP